MKRLKVLFITTWYPTRENPVGGVFVREHAKAVNRYDDVVVIHSTGRPPRTKGFWSMEKETDESLTESITTFRLHYRRFPIPKTNYLNNLFCVLKIFDNIWFFKAFDLILSLGFRPDIIHVHHYDAGIPCIFIGKTQHIPVVITEHSSTFPRRMLSRLEIIKAKLIFRNAALVFPVSYALQKGIEDYGIRGNFEVVPNAVDTSVFYSPAPPKRISNPKKILFVGLLVPVKGISILFQALAQLRQRRDDWQLDIVGDGPFREEDERLADSLGLAPKVTFHGLKTKGEVAGFMREADLLVLPSIWENLPCVVIEAMASGLPIVSTLTGGIAEIVNSGGGILVPPANPGELSNAIALVLQRIDEFDRVAICQKAQEYSLERVGASLHSLYERCLKQ